MQFPHLAIEQYVENYNIGNGGDAEKNDDEVAGFPVTVVVVETETGQSNLAQQNLKLSHKMMSWHAKNRKNIYHLYI